MVRIGLDGRVTMGYSVVSVDGIVPAPLVGRACFWPGWFTSNELVYHDGNVAQAGPWQLHKLNLTTNVVTVVDPGSANIVDAGGGIWAAWLGSDGFVRTSDPDLGPYVGAGLADVADDGRVVIIDKYHGGGLTVYRPNGSIAYQRPDLVTALNYNIRLTGNLLSYLQNDGRWHIIDISTGNEVAWAPQLVAPNWLQPVLHNGRLYVMERSERLTLREATRSDVWVLRDIPDTYYPDVRSVGGKIRVACCSVIGEAPNSLMVFDVTPNLSAGTVSMVFGTTTGGPLTFAPPVDIGTVTVSVGEVTTESLVRKIDLPYRHPFLATDGEAMKKGLISREWQIALQRLEASIQNVARTVGFTPAPLPTPPPAEGSPLGFTTITSPGEPEIVAFSGGQRLAIQSDDASIEVTLTPGPQVVNLRAGMGSGYWTILTNGDAGMPEPIYADGDVVAVWVPVP